MVQQKFSVNPTILEINVSPEAYSVPCQTSQVERFAKEINDL